jgi:hypothetical protein
MKSFLSLALSLLVLTAVAMSLPADAGERVVCRLFFTDGGVTAQSTATPNAATTDDGRLCPSYLLQSDSTLINPQDGGTLLPDGGTPGCPYCNWGSATSIAMQCDNPVYVDDVPSGVDTFNGYTRRTIRAATSADEVIDFDVNPDPYRWDWRSSQTNVINNLSVKPVSSSSNVCRFSTIQRNNP